VCCTLYYFVLLRRRPPSSTLFPYTTLFRSHRLQQRFVIQRCIVQAQLRAQWLLGPQQAAHAHARGRGKFPQALQGRRMLQVFDDLRLDAAVADHRQGVARGAAAGVVVDRDRAHGACSGREGAGNRWRVRLTMATSDSITGTSTSTPTTVASAAPECRPNSEIATA